MCAGAALLGYLDFFFKKVRDDERPFGGIQMLFCGDNYQLPPVEKGNPSVPDWAFLSEAWIGAKVKVVELTKVFRQADQVFAGFLNSIRKGEPLDKDYVRGFVRQLTTEESMCASYLVPTNAKADKLNNMVLGMYAGPTTDIAAKFEISPELLERYDTVEKVRQQLETALRSKTVLALRIGAPVLFKINDRSDRYVNGTKGFVVRFLGADMKEVTTGDVEVVEVRIPKRGDTEEQLIQVQRWVTSRNPREDPDEMTQCMDSVTGAIKTVRRWPVVKQFPLIPATALTIHSAQGMSLDECVVDLHQSFAPGHVYVAMSRLRTAAGLTLASERFDVVVDPHVTKFYNDIK
jgi:ATP-dependent DNA helicase PIF1